MLIPDVNYRFLLLICCILPVFFVQPIMAQTTLSVQESVAILFLIDESGGVSGECDVAEDLVFVVDEEEKRRYKIPRFFLALAGSLYNEEYGLHDQTSLPQLQIGVAQFAEHYRRTYGFMSSSRVFEKSLSFKGPPAGIGVCYTDFVGALQAAGQDLEATGADHKILVLITDGSFRGSEVDWPATQEKHEDIRSQVENTLTTLNQRQIHTYAFLLGSDRCIEENNCGLRNASGNDEYGMRKGDMRAWEAWDNPTWNDRGFELLDANDIVPALTGMHLVPDQPINTLAQGLGTPVKADDVVPITFAGWAARQAVNFVSVKPLTSPVSLKLRCPPAEKPWETKPDKQRRCPFYPDYEYSPDSDLGYHWWRYDLTPAQVPPQLECGIQTWNLMVQGGEGYVWRQFQERAIGASLTVTSTQDVNMGDLPPGYELPVIAHLHPYDFAQLCDNSCYKMRFELDVEHEESSRRTALLNIDDTSIADAFDLSDIPCPSRKAWLSAQVLGVTPKAGTTLEPLFSSESIELSLRYQPQVMKPVVEKNAPANGLGCQRNPSLSYQISIPIRYATETCNPGFLPKFRLVRTEALAPDNKICPNAEISHTIAIGETEAHGRYESRVSEDDEEETAIYEINLFQPSNSNLASYWECGYTTLKVEIDGEIVESIEYHHPGSKGAIDVSVAWLLTLIMWVKDKHVLCEKRENNE